MHAKMISKKRNLTQFLELFLSLIQSGIPLSAAVKILSEKEETRENAQRIKNILENGGGISKAFCSISRRLKPYESLLSVTEETGEIGPVLEGITEEVREKEDDIQNLTVLMLYPIFVCFLALSLSFMLIKYGIQYISLIAEVNKAELIKTVFSANLTLLFLSAAVFILIRYFWHRYSFETFLFWNLYCLNKSAVGMEESFALLLREKSFSRKELKCISFILSGLREGRELYGICEESGFFDAFCSSWLYVAEESGEVNRALKKIYENYRKKKKEMRERAVRFMEPALLALSGIYVLILITGCVIPVFMSLGSKIL